MDRKGYNDLQKGVREMQNASLARFKEKYPERFKELQEKAKADVDKPIIRSSARRLSHQYDSTGLDHLQRVGIDYFIYTVDRYGDNHTYFEGLESPDMAEEVLTMRRRHYTERGERVTGVEACTCPRCV